MGKKRSSFSSRGSKKRQSNHGLGKALVNAKRSDAMKKAQSFRHGEQVHAEHIAEERTGPGLKSVVDVSDFSELVARAEAEGRTFMTERTRMRLVGAGELPESVLQPSQTQITAMARSRRLLRVPRRPVYKKGRSGAQQKSIERKAFLDWRRGIAELEEERDLTIAPFEKNLEIWRQLWRVIERSDVLVQIVDARTPLFFRSADLSRYIREVSQHMHGDPEAKRQLLLLNKADLVPPQVRKMWCDFCSARGIDICYFSALREELLQKESAAALRDEARQQELQEVLARIGEVDTTTAAADTSGQDTPAPAPPSFPMPTAEHPCSPRILSRTELLSLLEDMLPQSGGEDTRSGVVGMVGFPNVGKSSVINVLAVHTGVRAAVAPTPGKTKHFQTVELDDKVMLCDCPGLVFPSFAATRAELLVQGVLSIDHEREYMLPVAFITGRIPARVLEKVYRIELPALPGPPPKGLNPKERYVGAEQLCVALSSFLGVFSTNGPNRAHSARIIVKDYLKGKLLWLSVPPKDVKPVKRRSKNPVRSIPSRKLPVEK
eukprot:gnl/Dysnectes_brevis/1465_a1659_1224.p1 GENE.gnl/Dysnectes_brevis/1465_a1659_1224~~gnl/Dysnectes_brevis/1465_a1659_1224.p1  ORF type:complete len:548 (-),score=192.85 gnl/Dysnectes_brevis/1465_a1659_1224:54-1697(-)